MPRMLVEKKPLAKPGPRRRRKAFFSPPENPSPRAEGVKEKSVAPSFAEIWIAKGRPAPIDLALSLGLDPREALKELRRYREGLAENSKKELSAEEVLLRAVRLAQRARFLEGTPDLPPAALEALSRIAALLPLLEEGWQALVQE